MIFDQSGIGGTDPTRVFQEWRWALQPTSPFTPREPVKPNLRFILRQRAQERQFETLRSLITTTTPTLSSTPLFNRYRLLFDDH